VLLIDRNLQLLLKPVNHLFEEVREEIGGANNTYKSLLNDDILGFRLRVEITYPKQIYENQIAAFLKYRKQMIDKRNRLVRAIVICA
jgi:hypothetical protein